MLTLLDSRLGSIAFARPRRPGLISDWQDRRHERAILDQQMAMQKQALTRRLEEIALAAGIAESQAPRLIPPKPTCRCPLHRSVGGLP